MTTISIRVEPTDKGIRAYINTESNGNIYASRIKEPFSKEPFYILDGKRHELKDHEKKKLRELINEVKNDGRQINKCSIGWNC